MFIITLYNENFNLLSSVKNAIDSMLLVNDEKEDEINKKLRDDGVYIVELIVKKRMKEVNWKVHSDTDSRWNKEGICFVDSVFNVLQMNEWLEECKKKFGEAPCDCIHESWIN